MKKVYLLSVLALTACGGSKPSDQPLVPFALDMDRLKILASDEERPACTSENVHEQYVDSYYGNMIYCDGAKWVDLTQEDYKANFSNVALCLFMLDESQTNGKLYEPVEPNGQPLSGSYVAFTHNDKDYAIASYAFDGTGITPTTQAIENAVTASDNRFAYQMSIGSSNTDDSIQFYQDRNEGAEARVLVETTTTGASVTKSLDNWCWFSE